MRKDLEKQLDFHIRQDLEELLRRRAAGDTRPLKEIWREIMRQRGIELPDYTRLQ